MEIEEIKRKPCKLLTLPMLPLRETVVYPAQFVPLFVGRPKSLRAIEEAMQTDREILVVAQKAASVEDPATSDLFQAGTVCQIMQVLKLPDGIIKILVEGLYRGVIRRYVEQDEYFSVEVEEVADKDDKADKVRSLRQSVLALFEQYLKLNKKIPMEIFNVASKVDHPGRMADIIATHLPLKLDVKQSVLEAFTCASRLELLASLLNSEIEILNVEKRIRGKARRKMETLHKEQYLREQMRNIQKELGDANSIEAEIDEYLDKIKKAKMPEVADEKCIKEAKKLGKMVSSSAEAGVIRSYLDLMVDLPWSKSSKDKLSVTRAQRILDEDHYGLKTPKERILEFLAVCKLKRTLKGPIICLLGPPGVGKTSIAKSVARAMGRTFGRISLGGLRDEAEIRGHRRTYVGAMPGRIMQLIRRLETNNPVILLDEIDKTGADFKGDPASALLEVLDPEQNSTFMDHYLSVPFDLSRVLFLTTANVPHTIPPPLKDRMEIIQLPGYTEEEKLEIAKGYLVRKQMKENGLKAKHLLFPQTGLVKIIRQYTREAGVRELERKIGSLCRKVAKKLVSSKKTKDFKLVKATPRSVEKFLGVPRFTEKEAQEKPEVGLVTGLAWTQAGGNVLPIEAALMPGAGKLHMTGRLGEVMKESAQAAFSYARKHHKDLKIDKKKFQKCDIHVHAHEGAVPKDGPSAGITIATAVISALTQRPVDRSIAMTGELTLTGKVLPVGGIKEKVLAAFRLGLMNVILPAENEKLLEDIPKNILRKMKLHLVSSIGEVLSLALLPQKTKSAGGS